MENIRDWCVSRQLWWGHQIPVFYCDACGTERASMEDLTRCPECGGPVRQDEDVLDTWFSSQLWPFAVFGWPDETPELQYFYPTSVLSTARDILFLWVARMVMSGLYFRGDVPFADVIIHPTVFNAEGKRMSKSLGTGVDPLDLMAHYGADGMRFGLMLQVTGNQDIKFAEEKLASSRNFANKIWNASRFVLMNVGEEYVPGEPKVETVADAWILSRLADLSARVDEGLLTYEFGETARALYDFFWSEFCDWYIELAKPRLAAGGEGHTIVLRNLVFVLDRALRLLHPMMPFVTEEIWGRLPLMEADKAEALMVAAWPSDLERFRDEQAEASIARLIELVTGVRAIRARYGLSPKQGLRVVFKTGGDADMAWVQEEFGRMKSLAGVESFGAGVDAEKPPHSAVFVAGEMTVYVPLEGLVDFAAERQRIVAELGKAQEELARVAKKLSNEGFLAKAAQDIIEKDRAKAEELTATVAKLTSQLNEIAE
jgi:valyl-tRNA synthetase